MNGLGRERFRDERSLGRQLIRSGFDMPAGYHDVDMRPFFSNLVREPKPVGSAIHIDIRKEQGHVGRAAVEHRQRPIPAACVAKAEARFFDDVAHVHQRERIVVDNERERRWGCCHAKRG